MSGLKGDCKSSSAVSDAPTAENSGTVPTDAGVREVSCVRRGESSFVPLLWYFGSWFRFMVLNMTGRLTTVDPIHAINQQMRVCELYHHMLFITNLFQALPRSSSRLCTTLQGVQRNC